MFTFRRMPGKMFPNLYKKKQKKTPHSLWYLDRGLLLTAANKEAVELRVPSDSIEVVTSRVTVATINRYVISV